jgi:hypothetical protein
MLKILGTVIIFVIHVLIQVFFSRAAISQLIEPANPFAVLLDHDYVSVMDPFEQFLKSMRVCEITESEIRDLEVATVGQADNLLWKSERLKRISASRFGRICKMTDRTDPFKLAKSMMSHRELNTDAVVYGRMHESIAVNRYEEMVGVVTKPCGLFVSTVYPFLCASPDRVVSDQLLLEVKCPYTARDVNITPESVPFLTDCYGVVTLKTNHEYYYQIQGQMLCTGASAVDFVIYTNIDTKIIKIDRHQQFIDEMIVKLQVFFNTAFRQALLEKFVAKDYYDDITCKCQRSA